MKALSAKSIGVLVGKMDSQTPLEKIRKLFAFSSNFFRNLLFRRYRFAIDEITGWAYVGRKRICAYKLGIDCRKI